MPTYPEPRGRPVGGCPVLVTVTGLALLGVPSSAGAQGLATAAIEGRVVEVDTQRPIPLASVRLVDTDRLTESDEDGRFEFRGVPLGRYVLTAEHLSYAGVSDSVSLRVPSAVYDVEIRLAVDAIELAGIAVQVRTTPGLLGDVRERMERMELLGLGDVFDREAIDASGVIRVSHLVGQLPGARLRPLPGRVGAAELFLHARNDCAPSYYLDGQHTVLAGASVDDLVPLNDVEALEVYRRLSTIPGQFADERALNCGVVAIWTRRGQNDGEPFGWARLLTAATFVGLSFLSVSLWF